MGEGIRSAAIPLPRGPRNEDRKMHSVCPADVRLHAVSPIVRVARRSFASAPSMEPYRLPDAVQDALRGALAPFRNRNASLTLAVFLGRYWSASNRLRSAFPIDRRALAGHAALDLTEAQVRGALQALERVGFLDRVPVIGRTHKASPTGELHRLPSAFRFGLDFLAMFDVANSRATRSKARLGSRRLVPSIALLRPFTAPLVEPPKSPRDMPLRYSMSLGDLARRQSPPTIPKAPDVGLEAAISRLQSARICTQVQKGDVR